MMLKIPQIVILCATSMALSSVKLSIDISEPNRKALIQLASQCAKDIGASQDDILALHAEPPYPMKGACILKCLLTRVGFIKDGQFSKTGMMTALAPVVFHNKKKLKHLQNVTEVCDNEIKKSDPNTCESANNVMLCLKDHAPELLFNRISIDL